MTRERPRILLIEGSQLLAAISALRLESLGYDVCSLAPADDLIRDIFIRRGDIPAGQLENAQQNQGQQPGMPGVACQTIIDMKLAEWLMPVGELKKIQPCRPLPRKNSRRWCGSCERCFGRRSLRDVRASAESGELSVSAPAAVRPRSSA